MYAIVDIAGKQFRVTKDFKIIAPKFEQEVGAAVEFDRVLLISDNGNTRIGTPTVAGAKVQATVVGHGRDKKIIVFKKKRRKGYRVRKGHRQHHTVLHIDEIVA